MPDHHSLPRLALIGVSGYAREHLNFLLSAHRAGKVMLKAAVAISPQEEAEQCQALRSIGCLLYTSHEALLKAHEQQIDLCIIPTPIHCHVPMTLAALSAGANVLVEKPLGADLGAVRTIQQLEAKSGLFVAVGFQDIYAEGTLALKRRLLERKLGKLISLKACGLWPRNDSYYHRNDWAGRLRVAQGNVLDSPINNALAHHLNLMLFFAGPTFAEPAAIAEVQAELFRSRTIESFDTAAVRLRTTGGTKILMLASHSSLENWSPEIMIEGSEGRAHWHIDQGLKIFSRAGTIVEEYPAFNYVNTMAHMYDRVLRRLTDNEVFICSTRIAAAHVACIAKIHEAAPICNIPPSELGTLEQGNASHTFVRNLEAHFRNAFSAGLLLREVNCPWGEAALTATRNAQFLAGGRSSSC